MTKRYTYTEIKAIAKKLLSVKLGEAILITIILPLGFSMIFGLITPALDLINPYLSTFVNFLYSAIYGYFILRATIKFTRHKQSNIFVKFFGTAKGMLNSVGVSLFLMIFPIAILIINWDIFVAFDYLAMISDPESVDLSLFVLTTEALYSSIIIFIVWIYTSVRLQFATYIVADIDAHFMEAIKKSWKYTKGNFFRVLFFPFAFFLWFLLILVTCGIAAIYVIPLMSIGYAVFYNLILRENGEDPMPHDINNSLYAYSEETDSEIDPDPLAEDVDEEEDIFESYYK